MFATLRLSFLQYIAPMPSHRFSWNAFDNDTVTALARGEGWGPGDGAARAWLTERIRRPNDEFVRRQKATLATSWLPVYPGTKRIVEHRQDAGIGPMGRAPGSLVEAARYVDRCRNSSRLRQYLVDALIRFSDIDREAEEGDTFEFVPRFALLKPSAQERDPRKPHDYQRQAWEKLSAHLAESQSTRVFSGMLVMPTGSGKTLTAVRWLMENVIERGARCSGSPTAPSA
jgi:flagellar biosynthesis GTPase FlhF